jgi:hypothetical protein
VSNPTHSPEGLEIMYEQEDGWSEWIHPMPGYRMQCCGCGLIHKMEFSIVPPSDVTSRDQLNDGETMKRVIIFRASREDVATPVGIEPTPAV